MKNIYDIINEKYDTMSKKHKELAEFIRLNPDRVAFMNVKEISTNTSVSEPTIIRFAYALGFDGFRSFSKALQDGVKAKLTTLQRFNRFDTYTDDDLIHAALKNDLKDINTMLNEIDTKLLIDASVSIKNCRNIYILGSRSSYYLAGYLNFYLNLISLNSNLLQIGPTETMEQLINATDKDVLIAISFPRYTKRSSKVVEFAVSKNIKIISITDGLNSPIAKLSNIVLQSPMTMTSYIDSLVAPLALINALLLTIGKEMEIDIKGYFKELEDIWHEYDIFEK
ncbi:MAG: MurR/RpiR family transcriptional regulator [Tissierellia bacterium]|nr:MurR/RpiR family transcriptional regulator [Tissierellia bacterium]